MSKRLTPTGLRADLYRILDEVIETGKAVEVQRGDRVVRIEAVPAEDRLSRLQPHPGYIVGDPGDLVHIDWSKEWKPYI